MWPAYSGCCSPNRSIGILQPLRVCVLQVGLSCRSRDANGQPERLPTRKSPTHSSSSQVLCIRILAQELKAGMQLAKNALPRDTFSAVTRTRASQTNSTMLPRRGGGGWCANAKIANATAATGIMAAYPHRTGARSESCGALHPIPVRPNPAVAGRCGNVHACILACRPRPRPRPRPAGKLNRIMARPASCVRRRCCTRPFHPSIHDPPDTQKPRVSYHSCSAIELYSLAMHAAACPRLQPRERVAALLATGADH